MKTNTNHTLQSVRSSRSRWNNHLANWKTYALAGGASMAAGTSADAQIVHTLVNESLSGTNASSHATFTIKGQNVQMFQQHGVPHTPGGMLEGPGGPPSSGRAFLHGGVKFFATPGNGARNYGPLTSIGHLAQLLTTLGQLRGAQINGIGRFTTGGNFGRVTNGASRAPAVQGYLGFETEGANHDLGWIKIDVGPTSSANTGITVNVIDYAYNSAGGPINPGETAGVPEPGTMALALMAAGAAGLVSIRRARAKIASGGDVSATRATEAIA